MAKASQAAELLASSIDLPSGVRLPGRICKAPMEEGMAELGGGSPNEKHFKLYGEWAKGGFGLIITGNVDVDESHIGTPYDIVSYKNPSDEDLAAWRQYAQVCKANGTPTVVQLVHPGRQAMRGVGAPFWKGPLAPSSVQMEGGAGVVSSLLSRLVFAKPRSMTKEQIEEVKDHFLRTAKLAHSSGFDGVQLHAAHGYLLAQFLSPHTNRRNDEYGATPYNRLRILIELIKQIRKECPRPFILGIKLNSADYVQGGLTEEEALQHVEWLQETGQVDFIEVSGGTYENGGFMRDESNNATTDNPREAFFAAFAERAKSALEKSSSSANKSALIMITGGLRSRTGMARAIEEGAADLVGLARPAAVAPHLPLLLTDSSVPDEEATAPKYKIQGTKLYRVLLPLKAAGAGFSFIWHCCQMRRIATGKQVDLQLGFVGALGGAFWQGLAPAIYSLLVPFLGVLAVGLLWLWRQ